jgi:hypothetical protein
MNINSVKVNVLLRILGKKEVRLPFGIRDPNTLDQRLTKSMEQNPC